jgi:proteasome accessory factor B
MAKRSASAQRVGKVERLLNLVAFLLKQEEPVPGLTIRAEVAGYGEPDEPEGLSAHRAHADGGAAVAEAATTYEVRACSVAGERRFERDKEILKSLGIPVEYIPRSSIHPGGYRITREACFLPRARLTAEERKILACLHTTAVLDGASPVLGALTSALQKLRFDEAADGDAPPRENLPIFRIGAAEQAAVQVDLSALIGAAKNRKTVAFRYHSMSRDAVEERMVEPYGVFLRAGKWYLVGRCAARRAVRMFRLDRMASQARVNEENPGQPDFERPRGFRLKKYLGSLSWESGPDPDAKKLYDAEIAFDEDAWWMARDALEGSRCRAREENGGARVTVPVYREEPLVRWLLKFGAHAVVLSPPAFRNLVIDTVRGIRRRHVGSRGAEQRGEDE